MGIEPLHEAYVLLPQEDVDIGPKLTGFVAEIKAHAGMIVLQGVDDFANRLSRRMHLALVAGAFAKRDGNAYCDADIFRILHGVPHKTTYRQGMGGGDEVDCAMFSRSAPVIFCRYECAGRHGPRSKKNPDFGAWHQTCLHVVRETN